MRVVVVGTSGAGKTSFARALAETRNVPHVELDELYWSENWTPCPQDEFAARVESATSNTSWVADGNYSAVRQILWSKATDIIWLNFSRFTVFSRIMRRTFFRLTTRQTLWAGNRETFQKTFLSRDSILLWSLTTFGPNQIKYRQLQSSTDYAHLKWHVFRRPHQADEFLRAAQTEPHDSQHVSLRDTML